MFCISEKSNKNLNKNIHFLSISFQFVFCTFYNVHLCLVTCVHYLEINKYARDSCSIIFIERVCSQKNMRPTAYKEKSEPM